MAVFSVAMLSTLTAGIDTAARATVGADLRVNSPYLSQDQLSAIAAEPGVTGVAPVYAEVTSTITIDGSTRTVSVLVVDADELRAVQRGVPGALDLPAQPEPGRLGHRPRGALLRPRRPARGRVRGRVERQLPRLSWPPPPAPVR